MQGPTLNNKEAASCIVTTAKRIEKEHPEYGADTVKAVVKEKLHGYPADLVDATLEPERRAEVEAFDTV